MTEEKQKTDDFLLGIARATNALISNKLDEGINLAIAALGKQLGVSSTCVYVNKHHDAGEVSSSIQYFWRSEPVESRLERNQNVPIHKLGSLFEKLSRGEPFEVNYSGSEGGLREHMGADGTQSIVMFPIFIQEEFWGAVALVEYRFERNWTEAEKSMLQALANSFGAAISRDRLEDNLESEIEKRTAELERSRTRFRLAVEGSQDGIWEWLPLTGESYWSPRMYEQLGYEEDEMPDIGEEFFDMIHPDDSEMARKMFDDHLEKRTPYEVEFRLRTKSGRYRWFKSTGQAVWNEQGNAVRMVGSHEDITARVEAERDLKESHRRMDALVQNLPGIVYRCLNTENWPMEYISKACEDIIGYSPEEFYEDPENINFGKFIHPDDREDVWEQVQASVSEHRPFRVIYRIIDRRGREKWLWEQGNGVFEDDRVISLEGCIFDISPIVRNQERVNGAIYEAEDSERRRIAGEIHDGLQQTLTVSALNLQYLEKEMESLSPESRKRYVKSCQFLEQGIKESRQIAHSLMPKLIYDVGLDKALRDLVHELDNINDVDCQYFSNLKCRLSEKIEVGLYRIAQEALNNLLKHAKATTVSVQLVGFDKEVQLLIEDDGIGFDKNKLDLYSEGFGLTGMKNRINSLSGSLLIDTKPGYGTSIVARVPLGT